MLTYFIYCRKSSEEDDRQVISNESQASELEPIAQRDGLMVRHVIKEAASAKTPGTRSQFNEMLRRIGAGNANAILSWHPNRLSRNATDAARLVDLMDQGRLLEIRTPGQMFRNTPADKFLFTLLCSQAKLENDNKGVDVRRGLRAKAEMGWYPGVAPLGYLNDRSKNLGERDIMNDPGRFDLVKRMWRLMLTDAYTPSQIVNIANNAWGFRTRQTKKQGGNPLGLTTLYHVFHNPFYCGWYEYPGGSGLWHEGKHEPMVSRAEFEQVQALLGDRGNPRPKTQKGFAFTGLIHCGACGGTLTAEFKRQVICEHCKCKFSSGNRSACQRCGTEIAKMNHPVFRQYTYYHCSRRSRGACKEPSIEEKELERQIAQELARFELPAAVMAWALRYVEEVHAEETMMRARVGQTKSKAYSDCCRRLENLVKLKTSPENADGSLLSDEEYGVQRRTLLEEKKRYEETPDETKGQAAQALKQSNETVEFARSARKRFRDGDTRTKRKILTHIASNLTLAAKMLRIEAKKPLQLLASSISPALAELEVFEPKFCEAPQGWNGRNEGAISTGLRDLKDVRTSVKLKKIIRSIYHSFLATS